MRIACVTGARGLVGRNLISLLIAAGFKVRALIRNHDGPRVDGVEYYVGDITVLESLALFLNAADCVFHCAAELKDESAMWAVNVTGSENVARASNKAGVGFFCLVSSAGVVGISPDDEVFESTLCTPRNAYERSKYAAEKAVAMLLPAPRLAIIRPTNVVDEERQGLVAQGLRSKPSDRYGFILKGGECAHLVHAKDVASAALHLSNLSDLEYGACFFVSQDYDVDNSFSRVWELSQRCLFPKENRQLISFPVWIPYMFRYMLGRRANKGSVKYSSARLISTGFIYQYSVNKMIIDFFNKSNSENSECV